MQKLLLTSVALVTISIGGAAAQITPMKVSDAFTHWGVVEQSSIGGYTMSDSNLMMDALGISNTRAMCDGSTGDAGLPINVHKMLLDNGKGIFCTVPYQQTVSQFIKALKSITTKYPGQLIGIGGPNEPNNFGFTSEYGACGRVNGGPDQGSNNCAKFMQALYSAVRSDSDLNGFKIWTIPAGGWEPQDSGLQWAGVPDPKGVMRADGGDMHVYRPNGGPLLDEMQCPGANECSNFGPTTWGKHYPGMTKDQMSKIPLMASEIGCDLSKVGCDTRVQAKLYIRIYADALVADNFDRAFIYAIRDCCNLAYGFFDSKRSARQAATNVSNFTAILGRKDSSNFTPTAVKLKVKGLASDGHYKLLQHSNGNYKLLIWNEKTASTRSVLVNFGSTSTIPPKRYDPTLGTAAQTTGSVNDVSMTLTVTDYPQIVEFGGSGTHQSMSTDASQPERRPTEGSHSPKPPYKPH